MYQFEWLSEKRGNFLNLLRKEGGTEKGCVGGGGGWGGPLRKGKIGGSSPGGNCEYIYAYYTYIYIYNYISN